MISIIKIIKNYYSNIIFILLKKKTEFTSQDCLFKRNLNGTLNIVIYGDEKQSNKKFFPELNYILISIYSIEQLKL